MPGQPGKSLSASQSLINLVMPAQVRLSGPLAKFARRECGQEELGQYLMSLSGLFFSNQVVKCCMDRPFWSQKCHVMCMYIKLKCCVFPVPVKRVNEKEMFSQNLAELGGWYTS